jgi:hypothetical protein
MKTNKLKIAELEAKIELIDYLITAYCDREITSETKMHLRNLKFGFEQQIKKFK